MGFEGVMDLCIIYGIGKRGGWDDVVEGRGGGRVDRMDGRTGGDIIPCGNSEC